MFHFRYSWSLNLLKPQVIQRTSLLVQTPGWHGITSSMEVLDGLRLNTWHSVHGQHCCGKRKIYIYLGPTTQWCEHRSWTGPDSLVTFIKKLKEISEKKRTPTICDALIRRLSGKTKYSRSLKRRRHRWTIHVHGWLTSIHVIKLKTTITNKTLKEVNNGYYHAL